MRDEKLDLRAVPVAPVLVYGIVVHAARRICFLQRLDKNPQCCLLRR